MRKHGYSDLLKTILRTERGLRDYRPTHRPYSGDVPPPPAHAEETLTALIATYPEGTAIGLQEITAAIAIDADQARRVRDWAIATDCWPWPRPGPFRPGGRSDPDPRPDRRSRRKDGAR